MKTKATVDEALARLSRAIDRPWDNGTGLPSYADDPPLTRFVNRWTKPSDRGSFTGRLPDQPAYPTEDPDLPAPSRAEAPRPTNPSCLTGTSRPAKPAERRPDGSRACVTDNLPDANRFPQSDHLLGPGQYPETDRFPVTTPSDSLDAATPPPPRRRLPRAAAIVAVLAGALIAGMIALPGAQEAPAATPPPNALVVDQPKASVTVDIQGKVSTPGVHQLPDGARVIDAIAASGGTTPGTDTSALNLARRLVDGEQIHVGTTPLPAAANPAKPPLTNLNTAPVYQLDALPGVGIVTAQRIIEYRNRHGRFTEVNQLRKIDGIGPARYDKIKDLVTV